MRPHVTRLVLGGLVGTMAMTAMMYTRISDFAVVPYPLDHSSRPEFAGFRREEPHHGG